eukprot:UN16667
MTTRNYHIIKRRYVLESHASRNISRQKKSQGRRVLLGVTVLVLFII